jgi:hypothetical protein
VHNPQKGREWTGSEGKGRRLRNVNKYNNTQLTEASETTWLSDPVPSVGCAPGLIIGLFILIVIFYPYLKIITSPFGFINMSLAIFSPRPIYLLFLLIF